jgi:long-subunit acyl-CoA synthetase (AMP-forming)
MRDCLAALRRHASEGPDKAAVSDDLEALNRREFVARIFALASALPPSTQSVGLLAPNGVNWAAAQLACAFAGKTLTPLPTFFSAAQLGHVVRDASIDLIWAAEPLIPRVAQSGVAVLPLASSIGVGDEIEAADGFQEIIYTSGTTGQPKGVRHGAWQISWSAHALAAATGATESDSYLSVLPLPLLLETICAIFVPAFVGGAVHFATALSEAIARGEGAGLARVFEERRPSASVLVPELLRVWVAELSGAGRRAPDSLRFVAVGGAPVPSAVADAAWRLGIPVHEGYGLSECCSVVAVNRVGERRRETVGRPLDGLEVRIVDGEIVVDGPTVTDGYVGQPAHAGPWRTGDLGSIDAEGRLRVHGRRDNVLVTSMGRNVSPEWIETMLLADPRVAQCALVGGGETDLAIVLLPSRIGADWFAAAEPSDIDQLVKRCCAEAPAYATPRSHLVVPLDVAAKAQLLTANGRIRRKEVAAFVRATLATA